MFAERGVAWVEGPDPPDILCTDTERRQLGVELVAWLDQQQIETYRRQEHLETTYLDAIRSEDRPSPEHFGWVVVNLREQRPLARNDSRQFVTELYEVIGDIDKEWREEDPVSRIEAFPQHGVLSRYLNEIQIHHPGHHLEINGVQWIGFEARGGAYTPESMVRALRDRISAKVRMYPRGLGYEEAYLLVHYDDRAYVYNTPFTGGGFGLDDVIEQVRPLIAENHGPFRKVFVVTTLPGEERVELIWPITQRNLAKAGIRANSIRLKLLVVLGSLTLIVAGWIFLSRFMRLGYLDSAIGSMRTLVAAETKYAQTHPEVGYTCSMSALQSDEFKIVEQLRNGTRNGYAFQIGGCQVADAKRPNAKYQLTARPLHKGMSAYCSDQSGIVKYDEGGSVQKCLENGVPF